MAVVFTHAQRHLQQSLLAAGELGSAQELLLQLGKEALIENGDWVLLHRERPMELPIGG